MAKPLNGVRILDLTHMLSGPYGAMILADLGAETIKVEPLKGEGTRRLLASDPRNSLNGQGAYFITLNRNKQSVALDLKSEAGLAVFYDLVRSADIVIENFSAGVARKLKIDYEHLSAINPRIITCAISGFGSNGPNFQRPAFDQVVQALGGGMSITGTDAAHPTRAGIPIGDLGGGMFGVMGVLSALYERERSGAASTSISPCSIARSPCSITWRQCFSSPARCRIRSATAISCTCPTTAIPRRRPYHHRCDL
jgi:CoA:oxalate CoA-transferase